jgi:ornithine--oxo-acid transaminase
MTATANPIVSISSYADHVNPQWVALLDLLGLNVTYTECSGAQLHTSEGRCILDFLSGYCVHNTGHNHPAIIEALKLELDQRGPVMLQSHVSELAGLLGRKLCALAGGGLKKVAAKAWKPRSNLRAPPPAGKDCSPPNAVSMD